MTKLVNVVTFCGVGGTGKTSVMNEVKRIAEEKGVALTIFPSVVRSYYASRGVADEKTFLQTMEPQGKIEFQIGLIEHYVDTLEAAVAACTTPTLLADRSIFDHMAYTIYGSSELLTREIVESLAPLVARFEALSPTVFKFPFPTPWWGVEAVADGFRHNTFAKEFMLDSLMTKFSSKRSIHNLDMTYGKDYEMYPSYARGVTHELAADSSVAARAHYLIQFLQHWRPIIPAVFAASADEN